MTPFFEKLGEMANNKYSFLRLREALVDKDEFSVVLNFVIPPDLTTDQWNSDIISQLEAYVKDILPSDFKTQFRYSKSVLDNDVFVKVINDYIKENQAALIGQYDDKNIDVKIENSQDVLITIPAYDITIKYCKDTDVASKLTNYLNRSFCANVKIVFKSIGKPQSNLIKTDEEPAYIDKGIIYVKNRVNFFGGDSLVNPRYICNCTKPSAESVICGRLINFERHISKKGKIFYTFELDDSTGTMRCISFSRSSTKGAFDWLLPTDEYMALFGKRKKVIPLNDADVNPCLVVEGEIVEDTYKKGLTFMVRRAGCCRIDFDEINENRSKSIIMKKHKHRAVPVPYSGTGASSLFDLVDEPCDFIKNNSFVVFDLETTGLDTTKARIIELGAVKVENGEITSYYNSLVDPKMPIPEDASKVNNIFDKDVEDAPYIEDCLEDFMDYCRDSILVAHNGDNYDFKILRRECYDNNIPMENRLMDSLTMSRKAYPEFPNHKLDTLCKKLQVELINAHRAYFDAEATAKVFIKLANKMKLK